MKTIYKILFALSAVLPFLAAYVYDTEITMNMPWIPALRESIWASISSQGFFVIMMVLWVAFTIFILRTLRQSENFVSKMCAAFFFVQMIPALIAFFAITPMLSDTVGIEYFGTSLLFVGIMIIIAFASDSLIYFLSRPKTVRN